MPDDMATWQAAYLQVRELRLVRDAELAIAKAQNADALATITHQKLVIAKLQHALHGSRSERSARLIHPPEMAFADAEFAAP